LFSVLAAPLAAAEKQLVDPGAAEALLRAELAPSTIKLNSAACVKVDGQPLAADVLRRLRDSGIDLALDETNCPTMVVLGDFSFRPELGTYEMRFSGQLFGGSNIAVMKHFDDGWHVITTYHVGVWL
jgi:hypothetical protein